MRGRDMDSLVVVRHTLECQDTDTVGIHGLTRCPRKILGAVVSVVVDGYVQNQT